MAILDLSRAITAGMPVFPGDPEVRLSEAGAAPPWRVTALQLGTHSGTHIDAAAHYVPGGLTIDAYPLERFVLDCIVVDALGETHEAIGWRRVRAALPPEVAGLGVLLHTGWDAHWGTEAALDHPYHTEECARRLAAEGAALVGTDALNVDATAAPTTGVHDALLGADVLVVENLVGLGALEKGRPYRCAFVPLKLSGCDGSPIRAYAWV